MAKKKLTPFNLPIPGWNERRMTSEDFEALCRREGIQVISEPSFPTKVRGYCALMTTGETVIYISPRLKGRERVRVQFHELGHYFLQHHKQKPLHSPQWQDDKRELTPAQEWAELEADVAALLSTAPGFINCLRFTIALIAPDAGRCNWMKHRKERKR